MNRATRRHACQNMGTKHAKGLHFGPFFIKLINMKSNDIMEEKSTGSAVETDGSGHKKSATGPAPAYAVSRISVDDKRLRDLYPTIIYETGSDKKPHAYGAVSDSGELLGICILNVHEFIPGAVELMHVTVAEEFRGRGICTALLEHAFTRLREAGAGYLFSRLYAINGLELLPDISLLVKHGFYPLIGEEHVVTFDSHLLEKSRLVHAIDKYGGVPPHVIRFDSYADPMIAAYNKEFGNGLFELNKDTFSLRHSRFYVKNNRILAYVRVSMNSFNIPIIQDAYMTQECMEKKVSMALLAASIKSVTEESDEGLTTMVIRDPETYAALGSIIGEPDVDIYGMEMIREL